MVALGGHAWSLWGEGHTWLLWGGHVLLLRGHGWLLGGMHGCSGACVVAPGGHAWLLQGACMVALGGHAWDTMRYGDMINEWAVCILLECILVK